MPISDDLPERLQLSRRHALPDGAIPVGRGTRWGNPFVVAEDMPPQVAVSHYAAWLADDYRYDDAYRIGRRVYDRHRILKHLPELAGHALACWCPPGQACHARVLLLRAAGRPVTAVSVCTGRDLDGDTGQSVGPVHGLLFPGPLGLAVRDGWAVHQLPGRPPAVMCPDCAKPDRELARLCRSLGRSARVPVVREVETAPLW